MKNPAAHLALKRMIDLYLDAYPDTLDKDAHDYDPETASIVRSAMNAASDIRGRYTMFATSKWQLDSDNDGALFLTDLDTGKTAILESEAADYIKTEIHYAEQVSYSAKYIKERISKACKKHAPA